MTHTQALILHSQWGEFGPQLVTAACPLPLLSEEKQMIEDCVLCSSVVWLHPWHFVPVKYRQVSRPTHRAGCWMSWNTRCGFLVQSGVCPPPRKQPFSAAQLCVRQAQERGNEVVLTTGKTATISAEQHRAVAPSHLQNSQQTCSCCSERLLFTP